MNLHLNGIGSAKLTRATIVATLRLMLGVPCVRRRSRGVLLATALGAALLVGSRPLSAASPASGGGGQPGAGGTSQAGGMVPTNLPDVFAFPAPPPGFDPTMASADELRRYGLPLPPDWKGQPAAYAQWADAMHHAQHYIVPTFTVQPGVTHNAKSPNWSGTVTTSPAPSNPGVPPPYTETKAWGLWKVPDISASTQSGISSTWVGLDGWGNNQVEQIGTDQTFLVCTVGCTGTHTRYDAWWELYPDSTVYINNLAIAPGDYVMAKVNYDAGANVIDFFMLDERSNTLVAFQTAAKYGAPGVSAEWIEEGFAQQPFPNFGTVNWPLLFEGTSDGDSCLVPKDGSCKHSAALNPTLIDMWRGGVQLDRAQWFNNCSCQAITWMHY